MALDSPSVSQESVADPEHGPSANGPDDESTQRLVNWLSGRAQGERVLVVGSRGGRLPVLIARDGKQVTGLEADPDLAAEADRRVASEEQSVRARIRTLGGSTDALPGEPGSFDCVVLGEAPREGVAAVLGEARRVLPGDGGVLVLALPVGLGDDDGAHPGASLVSVLEALVESFAVERIEPLEGSLGIVARPLVEEERAGAGTNWVPVVEAVEQQVAMIESRLHIERDAAVLVTDQLGKARERLARSRRKLRRSKDRAARIERKKAAVEKELKRLQRTRTVRLGRRLGRLLPGSGQGRSQSSSKRRGSRDEPREASSPSVTKAPAVSEPVAAPEPGTGPERADTVGDVPDGAAEETPSNLEGTPSNLELLFPPLRTPDGPTARPGLRVACIMDEFSKLGFAPEFEYVDFGPDDWRSTLDAKPPDLLLVESAWRGLDGSWKGRIARFEGRREPDEALGALLAWCRERDIPTVFWGKEDPPNFDRFVDTALSFDHIFTTDEDSISRYVERAGHDRVALLPFALQPRIHNPAGSPRPRPFDVAFAGSYWHGRYPDRKVQMETVLGPALDFGLHIFSRRPGEGFRGQTTVPGFPGRYAEHVVGTLPYENVLTAYRRYKVFLNVNSVPGSRTMCARRIFELLACGTTVVSGVSPAIERLLGPGLVHESSSKTETRELLGLLLGDDEQREREATRALRRLLASHTYGQRVQSILSAVGISDQAVTPRVSVLCVPASDAEVEAVLANVARQQYEHLELVVVLRGPQDVEPADLRARAEARGIAPPVVATAEEGWALGDCLNAATAKAAGDYLAIMDPESHYGPAYLTDLVNAFSYARADAAGKDAHYTRLDDARAAPTPGREHAYVEALDPRTLVISRPLAERLRFASAEAEGVGEAFAAECRRLDARLYAADRFNFVAAGGTGASFEEIDV